MKDLGFFAKKEETGTFSETGQNSLKQKTQGNGRRLET
jgi:hypothetical protein